MGLSILYVLHGFPPDTWAGTEVYTLDLARAMQARGHRVAIAARAPPRSQADADWTVVEDRFEGLAVHRILRRVEGLPIGESYRSSHATGALAPILDREKPDVVHFQHLLHLAADLVPATKARGIPCVVTLNDYWALCARVQLVRPDGVRCERNQGMGCFPCVKDKDPRLVPLVKALGPVLHPLFAANSSGRMARSWIALRERHGHVLGCLAQADLLVAPSRFLRQKFLETGFLDPERILHSDYGTRTDQAGSGPIPKTSSDVVRFGFVGSLVEHKGIEVLVRAMNELDGARCVLEVFGGFRPGSDPFHDRLRALARADNIRFRGPFDRARIAEVYRGIDVLVVPSLWFENSPLTIHEAFLFRTPVVASGIGGMAELVRDGLDGLHAPPGDASGLAAILRRFLDDPSLAERLARNVPRVKSIEEDAQECEARYLALARP